MRPKNKRKKERNGTFRKELLGRGLKVLGQGTVLRVWWQERKIERTDQAAVGQSPEKQGKYTIQRTGSPGLKEESWQAVRCDTRWVWASQGNRATVTMTKRWEVPKSSRTSSHWFESNLQISKVGTHDRNYKRAYRLLHFPQKVMLKDYLCG